MTELLWREITQSPLAAVIESSLNAQPRRIKVVDTFRGTYHYFTG
jgi:hypothetical protein